MKKRLRIESEGMSQRPIGHATWGEKGNGDGQFLHLSSIKVATDETIYVADQGNHRIQCFNPDGKFIRKFGRYGTADGAFRSPIGLAIGVDAGMNESITTAMMSIPQVQALPPGLLPICVAYVGEEHIAVVDRDNNRLQVFKTDGTFVRKWGNKGSTDGQFLYPTTCDLDGEGLVYIADSHNYRIQVFKWDGTFVRKWGSRGSGTEQFGILLAISISVANKVIYIADTYNYRITCCNLDGTWSRSLPVYRAAISICVDDEDDALYVCDMDDYSLRKLRAKDGTLIYDFRHCGARGAQVVDYKAVAGGNGRTLYIAELGTHRISVIHPN